MSLPPVPADPGWDEDLAWLDRDPVTAAEFEASLDRLCERDEGPGEDEDENYLAPLTAEELAEIREAAADELLAAKAASTGRGSRPTRTPASSPRSPSWPGGTRGSWTRSSPRTRSRTPWGSPALGPTV